MTLEVWNSIANTFAAIGTVGATITALFFGVWQRRIRLKCSAHAGLILPSPFPSDPDGKVAAIHITNVGEVDCVVQQIGWRWGKGKNRHFGVDNSDPTFVPQLPTRLAPGERYAAAIPFATGRWLEGMAKIIGKDAETLCLQVFLSIGKTITVQVDRSLREEIKEAYDKLEKRNQAEASA